MQRTYFLGSATPDGFATPFWTEQQACYGYYLKGGPGTGKSTLMKKIAAAFDGERVSVYHCASDPRSLDAVVLEDRGVFVADATAPHEASTPLPFVTGELVDLGAGLAADRLRTDGDAVRGLYAQNQRAHAQARRGLTGIGAMEDAAAAAGAAALQHEKLAGYAQRLAKRLFGTKTGDKGLLLYRQCSALTPQGKITFVPEGFDRILLVDPYHAAAQTLLQMLTEEAVRLGKCCEVTRSQTQTGRPVTHLILPEQRAMVAIAADPAEGDAGAVIRMQRFYDTSVLRQQRSRARFCSRMAAALETETAAILADALRVHDELERYFIGALDTAFLDGVTERLIGEIKER